MLGCAGIFFNLIWRHALNAGLVSPRADPNYLYALGRHWQLIPVFYGVAFALTFVEAYLSVVMYILLLLYYALPGPAVIRLMTMRRAHRTEALSQ